MTETEHRSPQGSGDESRRPRPRSQGSGRGSGDRDGRRPAPPKDRAQDQDRPRSGEQSEGSSPGRKRLGAMAVARAAAEDLMALTGRQPECVVGIERTDDGWEIDLEVVESRRIPDSTDILATYRVEMDEDAELMGYHRMRRYLRGKGGDGDEGRR